MSDPLTVHLNGQNRTFSELTSPTDLSTLIDSLGLKSDRVAIEHNGEIVPRSSWSTVEIRQRDRLEVVHFVGGGAPSFCDMPARPVPVKSRSNRSHRSP
jgi:sulfur carrier protein